ncbi:MAG: hypothetical protein ACREDK_04710 [Thermoplasmata archaeon]
MAAAAVLLAVNVVVGIIPIAGALSQGTSPNPYSLALLFTTGFAVLMLMLVSGRARTHSVERVTSDREGLMLHYKGGRSEGIPLTKVGSRFVVRAYHHWPAKAGQSPVQFLLDGPRFRGVPVAKEVVESIVASASDHGVGVLTVKGNALNRLEWTRIEIGS